KKWVVVRSPQLGNLVDLARAKGLQVATNENTAEFHGVESAVVGELAAGNGIVLHELSTQTGSLEDAFLEATALSVEYHGLSESAT
ncbi:MAG: ABC transporter ATP-binding protein, partial [Actinomycetes bacterium]